MKKNRQYRVAVVGIGAVGTEMIKVLRERKFPASEIVVMARSARKQKIAGEVFQVVETTPDAFNGIDFAFFAGTEGSKGASKTFGWEAVKRGAIVIDNGDDFRMDPRVPLVIPEINPEALKKHQGFISNPNCSTIIGLMAIAPLHRAVGVERIIAATYQSVSGTGRGAILELEEQVKSLVKGGKATIKEYPHQIAFNVIPQIGSPKDSMPGYTSEEAKLLNETRKILNAPKIRVNATCIRVPVYYGHTEVITVELKKALTVAQAHKILKKAKGLVVRDDLAKAQYPMPLDITGKDDVQVGRVRVDVSSKKGLTFVVSGDNIRKGAALNAVQIAEALIR